MSLSLIADHHQNSNYRSTIVLRGARGNLNWRVISIPRDAGLSESSVCLIVFVFPFGLRCRKYMCTNFPSVTHIFFLEMEREMHNFVGLDKKFLKHHTEYALSYMFAHIKRTYILFYFFLNIIQ